MTENHSKKRERRENVQVFGSLPYGRIYSLNAPCKGCSKRQPLCHSKCEPYIEYKQALTILYDERKEQRAINEARIDAIRRSKSGHFESQYDKYIRGNRR